MAIIRRLKAYRSDLFVKKSSLTEMEMVKIIKNR